MAACLDQNQADVEGNEFDDMQTSRLTRETPDEPKQHGIAPSSFSHFGNLPLEIRCQIWGLSCPDLTTESAVFEFQLVRNFATTWPIPGNTAQIDAAKTLLNVHHETRSVVMKRFPDTLPEIAGGRIPFNKERDVVYTPVGPIGSLRMPPGFTDSIKHLAVDPFFLDRQLDLTPEPSVLDSMAVLPALENLYLCYRDVDWTADQLRWCASKSVSRYHIRDPDAGYDTEEMVQYLYCWPDLTKNRDFAEREIRPSGVGGLDIRQLQDAVKRSSVMSVCADGTISRRLGSQLPRFRIWPMVEFDTNRGLSRFRKLTLRNGMAEDWDDSDDGKDNDGSQESASGASIGSNDDNDSADSADNGEDDEDDEDEVEVEAPDFEG